ncbi:MAG: hypothetical protein H6642_15290 [Caldilineaceae bacterium]|nr:hypothetical protein [Caldilineaceae bacterium]
MDSKKQPLTLTVLDTSGIQPYIFGANNLRQSVGASELVRWATEDAVREALLEVCGPNGVNVDAENLIPGRYLAFPPQEQEATPGLTAEWLNAGGGNTLILFENIDTAKEFTRVLTLKLYDKAPGVNLIVAHEEMEEDEALTAAVDRARKKAQRKKRNRQWGAPVLGLAVTADCQFTGLPATTEYEDRDRDLREDEPGPLLRISAEVEQKRSRSSQANERLQKLLAAELGDKYTLLMNFDQLGVKGEASFMGVVHIDGNGMGKRVQRIADDHSTPGKNREYIEALRQFSQSVEKVSQEALKQAVKDFIATVKSEGFAEKYGGLRKERGGQNELILPFRPIVYGGDDITFVCDGRFALSLAQRYMAVLESQELDDGKKLYVRGGVAVVKSHYPFARAYELAEELAQSAKALISERKEKDGADCSAMDWHFGTTGLVLDLEQIRSREYTKDAPGDLVMRPVLIRSYKEISQWRRWDNFTGLIEQFRCDHRPWAGKRNKIKALREVLRKGPGETRRFIESLGSDHELDAIDAYEDVGKSGWYGPHCAWADAIEALDLFEILSAGDNPPTPTTEGGNE